MLYPYSSLFLMSAHLSQAPAFLYPGGTSKTFLGASDKLIYTQLQVPDTVRSVNIPKVFAL